VRRGRGFVEQLEDRRPLAITPVFAAGVLTFTGDGADDTLVITSNNATSSDIDFSGTGIVGTVNQAGVTAIVINLDGGTDSVTLNGSALADTIALNALAISYGGTPYTLTDVENLSIDGQGDADTISATGVTVPGDLSINGGAGADALSVTGPLTTGTLTVSDPDPDDVELSGIITTTGNQQYNVPVTLVANTTLDAGAGDITFAGTVSGAAFTLDANSTGATTFGGAVNVSALTTNALGTTAINGDMVTTSGDQIYNDPVTLNSSLNLTTLTSTAGDVRFADTLDSLQLDEEILTVNGDEVEFNGAVGSAANGALSSLDVNAVGNVRIGAARIINTADLESTTGEIIDLNAAANNITANSLVASAATGISLDTTINNLLASNTTSGGIDISETNDVTVLLISAPGQMVTLAAGGAILDGNAALNNVTAMSLAASAVNGISLDTTIDNLLANNSTAGGIDINELDNLNVTNIAAAGQTVTLVVGGAILDGNGAANNITATSLVASAVTGISLDTTIANLVANSSTSGGIDINEVDNLNVSTVSAPGQTVTLTAGGALTDSNAAATNVTAASLLASAATGIDLDTTIADLTATNTTAGNIDISDTDNLNVLTVSAPGQTVTLTAGGAITDGNAAANNIIAASLVAGAVTGISLDVTVADLTATSTTSGNIDISDPDNLNVLTVSAPGQTVTLSAGGAITDGNAAANNVTAASLIAAAVTGINLDTTIGSISATNATSGDIDISEADDLSVLGISAPGQTVILAAGGAILDGNGPASNVIADSLTASAVTGITLGTTITNLTATNTTSGGIVIGETDDLNVLTVSATGQTVNLTAGGAITDGNAAAVNVTAASLIVGASTGISLDTTIINLLANNSTSGGIDINETDDLNVSTVSAAGQTVTLAAGGAITDGNAAAVNVTAASLVVSAVTGISLDTMIINLLANNSTSGGIDINETDDLNVSTVLAPGQTVTLSAGGALLDGNAAASNVTAASLIANAVTGISLDTTIANLTASNTTSGGIDINEVDSMSVLTVSAPAQTVTLTAGGAITDGNAAANNVTAAALAINAVSGISLDTTIADLTASNTTSGGVDISDADSLNVITVSAPAQAVALAAGGAITDGNAAVSNITSASLTANAVTGINLDTTIADLSATNTTSGGIDISEADNLNVLVASAPGQTVNLQAGGNLNVTTVNAGTATLIAAGAITDANGAALNVSATSLNALANNGIALHTAIANLTATNNTSGDIVIREANGVNVLSAINPAGSIQVRSANGLVTIATVDAAGSFVGSTSDAAAPGDNLIVTGTIEANSSISLIAGDDVTLQATSNVKSNNSFVYLKTDAATVDAAGGTLILRGTLQGNAGLQYAVVAEGDTGNDLFSILKLPLSPMAILARGGTLDNTFIVFTDAAEQINAFATVVDVVGQPGVEITYVDNEQLDLVTLGGDDKVFVQMPEPIHGILANIIRTSTGAGDDSLKINGSTLADSIRVASYTADANYRFQVRGDTGETECLQVFGFTGNDIIENSAPIASLLDGGNGQDHITGGDFAVQPATAQAVYDVIFGGGDADTLFGRAGNDFLYADHDYNFGAPVQTVANGDVINSGSGQDVIIALGADSVQRAGGDFEPDVIVGQNLALSINDFLFAQLLPPSANNVATQLQAGLNKKCAMPIP
jgi:hypothetical protein